MSKKRFKALKEEARKMALNGEISTAAAYKQLKKKHKNPGYSPHVLGKGVSGAYGAKPGLTGIERFLDKMADQ